MWRAVGNNFLAKETAEKKRTPACFILRQTAVFPQQNEIPAKDVRCRLSHLSLKWGRLKTYRPLARPARLDCHAPTQRLVRWATSITVSPREAGVNGATAVVRHARWLRAPLGRQGENGSDKPGVPRELWGDEVQILNLKNGSLMKYPGSGEVNVSESSRLPVLPAKKSHTHTWLDNGTAYIITDRYHNGSVLSNGTTILWESSGLTKHKNWKVALQWNHGSSGYPTTLAKSYSWTSAGSLWLWRQLDSECELWEFNTTVHSWSKFILEHVSGYGLPILAWSRPEDNVPCFLFADIACGSTPYTYCHTPGDTKEQSKDPPTTGMSSVEPTQLAPSTGNSTTTSSYQTTSCGPNTTEATVASPKSSAPTHPTLVATTTLNPLQRIATTMAAIMPSKPIANDSPYSVVDSTQSKWHQHNSGIFGSIIFFGTSITIFAIVGIVWCIRHCVHFPKEALLLRDPPSVRYTAIPDTIA
ncbi:hypothetical protein HPB48_014598 [Haemaphysalis longicornis]|uniref:Uncharacterized protein n=1 Tax=Haemaphysalis longicornis TaxID=44386 RepID=A0A9J6H1S2_HAELO|nr:hypothetical protein HPB48_014598 [Haemaphysalis longicornis]